MARPTLYRAESDRKAAGQRTANVVREVKETSGLTYRELSDWLELHHIIVSEGMLRQHGSGKKIMGARRLSQVVNAAYDEGWAGDHCLEELMFYDYDNAQALESLKRDSSRYRLLVQQRLYLCVRELYELGLSIAQIRMIVDKDCDLVEEELAAR